MKEVCAASYNVILLLEGTARMLKCDDIVELLYKDCFGELKHVEEICKYYNLLVYYPTEYTDMYEYLSKCAAELKEVLHVCSVFTGMCGESEVYVQVDILLNYYKSLKELQNA